ncbi:MAG: UDP-N-acetyl glucosamine 2-epimerase, partial [Flavobacteriaceae bacterium]|nr:UDP-N-acetyl glucosamine 2-epimerase [Flavobacteriaceae bacterium]
MNKTTVMTIVGTRPEIIKLSEVMKELDKHTNHIIVHTGQNYDYELNELFFEQLNVRNPDYFLEAVKGSPSETIGDIIAKADKILLKIKPDALLVYGDTNSCLSVIPAKKRKIPIFHMEAGNRCFDQRVPEEINRKIVDHLSDINLPLSEQARDYLIAEGIKPETIIKTGSPMTEVLNANMDKILSSDILKRENLTAKGYIVMSIHREENV